MASGPPWLSGGLLAPRGDTFGESPQRRYCVFPKGERVRIRARSDVDHVFEPGARPVILYAPWKRTPAAAKPVGNYVLENDNNERTLDDMEKGIARLAGKTIAAVITA